MPVASEIRFELGDDDEVALADFDQAVTSGAQIRLAGGVRLDRCDDLYPERAAHSTRAAVIRSVPITMATSTAVFRCWRKGLKPMGAS